MKIPRIVVVGSVNTDMVVTSSRLPSPGETIAGGRFIMAPGGKGANQAVAAARLGAEVALVAKVGCDVFGDQALKNFTQEAVQTEWIFRDPENHTGVALIMVGQQGENMISVASGANYALTANDLDHAATAIRTADALLLQLEIPLPTVCAAARLAAAAGVPVILDPAPAAHLPKDLLKHVAYLTPNETEAEQLTGIAVSNQDSACHAAETLLSTGVGCVIITLGAQGALVAERKGMYVIPAVKVDAVDATAAGDAFNAGLACALSEGRALQQAVQRASLAGALAATRLGAQPSLPTRAELDSFAQQVSFDEPHHIRSA